MSSVDHSKFCVGRRSIDEVEDPDAKRKLLGCHKGYSESVDRFEDSPWWGDSISKRLVASNVVHSRVVFPSR